MGGLLSKKDKILKVIDLSFMFNEELKLDIQAMCYSFANKFLNDKDLEKVKEVLIMTELGKMIKEEGIKEGIQAGIKEGIKEGKEQANIATAKNMIIERIPDDVIKRVTGISQEILDKLKKEI